MSSGASTSGRRRARVWATLHDPEQLPALFAELTVGPADPSWPAAGSSRTGEAHLGLLRTAVRIESLEARPLTAFGIVVVASSFAIEWGWRMEPLAGGTRVIHEGSFETTDRWAGVLVRLGPRVDRRNRRGPSPGAEGAGRATGGGGGRTGRVTHQPTGSVRGAAPECASPLFGGLLLLFASGSSRT